MEPVIRCMKEREEIAREANENRRLAFLQRAMRNYRSKFDRLTMAKTVAASTGQLIAFVLDDLASEGPNPNKRRVKKLRDEAVVRQFGAKTAGKVFANELKRSKERKEAAAIREEDEREANPKKFRKF